MGSAANVKPLAKEVQSSMRSGIIMFDLPKVVEELVLNSLDASASKVSVYVGIGTGYVKVVDDGCGISRDGLVLVGERYATSKKYQQAKTDAADQSFGSRGEALASISDVSLLEIFTRASGRPNGYHKVIKGSKCLYLGIDDDRKDIGTTVVVRDLFYNQPVRRKHMQSNSKKVLHLVKKCMFRIALVQSKVFFRVVDIESEEELLNTRPSSALQLLMNAFGIKDPNFLHQLKFGDGTFYISGYISCPCDNLAIKAFHYVYINSRFVCKGPIHKLLDRLATAFDCPKLSMDDREQKGKTRGQANLAYMLSLRCPPSLYDLTFESSKTYVEFKDWLPLLNFTEKSVEQLWSRIISCGDSMHHLADVFRADDFWNRNDHIPLIEEDFLEKPSSLRSKHEIQNPHLPQVSSSSMKKLRREISGACNKEKDKVSVQEFHMNESQMKEQQDVLELFPIDDHLLWSNPFAKFTCTMAGKDDINLFTSYNKFAFQDHCTIGNAITSAKRQGDQEELDVSSSSWKWGPSVRRNGTTENSLSLHPHDLVDDHSMGSVLKLCSNKRHLPVDRAGFPSEEGLDFMVDDFKPKKCRRSTVEDVHAQKMNVHEKKSMRTLWQDESFLPDSKLSEASEKSLSLCGEPFAEERDLAYDSLACTGSCSQENHCLNSFVTSDFLFQMWDAECFSDHDVRERILSPAIRTDDWDFSVDKEKECRSSYDVVSRKYRQDNHIGSLLDFRSYGHSSDDICDFLEAHNLLTDLSSKHSSLPINGNNSNWLLSDMHSKGHNISFMFEGRENRKNLRWEYDLVPKERFKRGCSAPPFYRHKNRFISMSRHVGNKSKHDDPKLLNGALVPPEKNVLKLPEFEPTHSSDWAAASRPNTICEPQVIHVKGIQRGESSGQLQCPYNHYSSNEGFEQRGTEVTADSGTKWRTGCQEIRVECLHNYIAKDDTQDDILDISSGFLHLAGSLLVPESVSKNFLDDCKVLQQLDKKFIPVNAGGTLAVIDQHAADERIRLEELHEKVLLGEAKTVTYLDAEQQLDLPEIGYQLLHEYARQIQEWGWICNVQAQGSKTFDKSLNILHPQATLVTLIAVPCILGVNLSDGDLLEFLQQLADTDGSSAMPPSVLRVLNLKACRGAIMFGDSLLQSECVLIVEELKKTNLCFQCAHGRPTTVPLVKLDALHEVIAKRRDLQNDGCESWHGLRRHELTLERAARRFECCSVF